nr:alanine racemase [Marinicella sp. W31]MDC2876865.1 alanine racemase [Marinicella sp. W31]
MCEYSNIYEDETLSEGEIPFEAAPTRLTVDLGAIVSNWKTMRGLSGSARTAAVVKADGYGLGIEDVGEALYGAGAADFSLRCLKKGRPSGVLRRMPGSLCCPACGRVRRRCSSKTTLSPFWQARSSCPCSFLRWRNLAISVRTPD